MRKNRSSLILFVLCLVLGVVSVTTIGAAKQPTITVMQNWPKGFGDRDPEYEDLFWQRAESELGIEIDMVYAVGHDDYLNKLPLMVGTDTAPDVVLYVAKEHLELDIFEPLMPYIRETDFPIEDFMPFALTMWEQDGELVALPTSRNHALWVYNANLLAEAGIPALPTEWDADPGWNWEYVKAISPKLTKSTLESTTQYGLGGVGVAELWPLYFGADWVDEDLNFAITAPETVEAVEYFAAIARAPYTGGSVSAGTAAMEYGMSWTVNTYKASGFQLSYAPLPKGNEQITIVHTDGAAILRCSKEKEAAWRFLEWLFKPENAVGFFTQQWNYLVPMRGVYDEWMVQMRDRLGSYVDTSHYGTVLYGAAPYGVRSPLFTNSKFAPLWQNLLSWGSDNIMFGSGLSAAINQETSILNHLISAEEQVSALLRQAQE